jgi:hypothetical protein
MMTANEKAPLDLGAAASPALARGQIATQKGPISLMLDLRRFDIQPRRWTAGDR